MVKTDEPDMDRGRVDDLSGKDDRMMGGDAGPFAAIGLTGIESLAGMRLLPSLMALASEGMPC
jgi:hypothetical protein